MASTCPNCGKKLHFWNIKAQCSACGVSIPNFDWEARLEEDNRNAEKAFRRRLNRTLSRMAVFHAGHQAAHRSPGADLFAGCGFHFTLVQYQRHWLQLCARSTLAFDGSKSLIDFFKAFFGDVGSVYHNYGYGGLRRSGDPWCDWLLPVLSYSALYLL